MKRNFLKMTAIALTGAAMALGISCNKEEDKPAAYLTVSEQPVSITPAGGTANIAVDTNTDDWNFTITDGDGWLSGEKTIKSVILTATANALPEGKRTATFTVTSAKAKLTRTVSIGQESSYTPYLTITKTMVLIPLLGIDEVVAVDTNTEDWTFSITGGEGWLTGQKAETGVKLTATFNESTDNRTAKLTVSSARAAVSREVEVEQDGIQFSASIRRNIPFKGRQETVFVETNLPDDWAVAVTTGGAWLTSATKEYWERKEGGEVVASGYNVLVTGARNTAESSRTAELTFTYSGKTIGQFQVTQDPFTDYYPCYFSKFDLKIGGDIIIDIHDDYHDFTGVGNVFIEAFSAEIEPDKEYYLTFELQTDDDQCIFVVGASTDYWLGWNDKWHHGPIVKGLGIDPNNESKWMSYTFNLQPVIDLGWRSGTLLLGVYGTRNLVKNLKITTQAPPPASEFPISIRGPQGDGVTVTDQGNYWEISQGSGAAGNLWINAFINIGEINDGDKFYLTFEYQSDTQQSIAMWPQWPSDWGNLCSWIGQRSGDPVCEVTGIDPANESLWKQYKIDLQETIECGWRTGVFYCEMAPHLLIRNMKIVRE